MHRNFQLVCNERFEQIKIFQTKITSTLDYECLDQSTANEKKSDHDKHIITWKDRVRLYRVRETQEESDPESFLLDHNHTHFILLKDQYDSSENGWSYDMNCRADLTVPLRARIEEESRKQHQQGHGKKSMTINHDAIFEELQFSDYEIPIVQILIEGGPSSILTVCAAIKARTPVVLVEVRDYICLSNIFELQLWSTVNLKGSGRAADLIASKYKYLYGAEQSRSQESYDKSEKKRKRLY